MRSRIAGLVLGLGLVAAVAAPALACSFHDQQASTQTQEQTAQAQQGSQQGSTITTQ